MTEPGVAVTFGWRVAIRAMLRCLLFATVPNIGLAAILAVRTPSARVAEITISIVAATVAATSALGLSFIGWRHD